MPSWWPPPMTLETLPPCAFGLMAKDPYKQETGFSPKSYYLTIKKTKCMLTTWQYMTIMITDLESDYKRVQCMSCRIKECLSNQTINYHENKLLSYMTKLNVFGIG